MLYDFDCKCPTHNNRKRQSAWEKRFLCGRKRKLTPDHGPLVLGRIAELREREGFFASRRLMDRTGIRHVSDRTVRRLLNRNGYHVAMSVATSFFS